MSSRFRKDRFGVRWRFVCGEGAVPDRWVGYTAGKQCMLEVEDCPGRQQWCWQWAAPAYGLYTYRAGYEATAERAKRAAREDMIGVIRNRTGATAQNGAKRGKN